MHRWRLSLPLLGFSRADAPLSSESHLCLGGCHMHSPCCCILLEEWTGCAPGSPSIPFRFRCHLTLASPHPEQGFARKQSAGAWFQPRSKLFSTDLASFLQTSFLPCVFVSFLSAPTWPWYHGLQSQTKQHTGGLHNQHVVEEAVTALNTQRLCCKDINISFVLNNGNKVTRFQSKETCQE